MNLAKIETERLKKMRAQLDEILVELQKETLSWK